MFTYLMNRLTYFENDLSHCRDVLRYRETDEVDCLEFLVARVRLNAFKSFFHDIVRILKLYEKRGYTGVKVVYLDLSDPFRQAVFRSAMQWRIIQCLQNDVFMAHPYKEVLVSLDADCSRVPLFGGFLECTKFALANYPFFSDVCSDILNSLQNLVEE